MYIRENKNRSGSVSVQIIIKIKGVNKVIKTIGCGTHRHEIDRLKILAQQEIDRLELKASLFPSEHDEMVEGIFLSLSNSNIRTVGPELIFGRIYDRIGFGQIKEELFRHLVISRLAFPLSKLKTTEYLYRYQGKIIEVDTVYRFLDKLNDSLKPEIEKIAFEHTLRTLKGNISVVFYDMTTLYFEASDEDDLRKTGFSKDGKHSHPQILIGLLVGLGGYAIGYDIFEGNTYEGHTLIPFLEAISKKFNLEKPVVVADSGLLTNKNIIALKEAGYEYIIGARLKNESKVIQKKIIQMEYQDGTIHVIPKDVNQRLIVHYSTPIYHRLRHRIEAHICIAFTAYVIYKELERALKEEKTTLSLKTASEITHNMYQITYQLPDSKYIKSALLKMDSQQRQLFQIIQKHF